MKTKPRNYLVKEARFLNAGPESTRKDLHHRKVKQLIKLSDDELKELEEELKEESQRQIK